jgi:surfeit locus 1 family protein
LSAALTRWRQAGLVWPTVFALAGLTVLIGLGTWQLQRKAWKDQLIAKIAERVTAPPIRLAGDGQSRTVAESDDLEYLHVAFKGRFHHDKERYLYAPARSGLGWHVYTPLEIGPARLVWVNRGFVPDARKAPATRAEGQPAGEVEVRGLIRAPARKGLFTPENDAAHNLWYWPEVAAMTQSAFPGALLQALPMAIDADAGPAPPGGLPRGGVTRLDLPNRHLEYALTWYGLALTLIGVYSAFAVSRLRASAPV